MLKKEWNIFLTALMFFTRIPCSVDFNEENLSKSTRYFPLIGWLTGLVAFVTLYLALLILPIEIAILTSMACGIFITGAFHEDGFADVCDGFGGGWDKENILRIMKDSRVGTFGVTGLVFILLFKFFALKSIIDISELNHVTLLLLIFVTAHSLSRLASSVIIFTLSYVRENEDSKAKPLAKSFTWKEVTGALIFGLIPLIVLAIFQMEFLVILVPVILAIYMLTRFFRKWIGGYTGDCLGATQQICEVLIYLFIIVVWKYI